MSTIGCGMIIKNEEKNLPITLNQVIQFADRICIVDTGSDDGSFEIIKKWKKIYATPLDYIDARQEVSGWDGKTWLIRNFSKARNIYIEHLDNLVDYIFTVDLGDDIDQPAKISKLVESNAPVYGFTIKRGNSRFTHHRLFKTKCGVRYYGAVHEYPDVHKAGPSIESGIVITHEAGNEVSQESSVKRNLRILEQEYRTNPSPRVLFYYAMSLRDSRSFKEASRIYKEYLAGPTPYWDERMFAWYYLIRCVSEFDLNEALAIGYKALAEDRRFSEIPMQMAYIYFYQKDYKKALAMCLLAHQSPPKSDMFMELCKYKEEPLKMITKIQGLK